MKVSELIGEQQLDEFNFKHAVAAGALGAAAMMNAHTAHSSDYFYPKDQPPAALTQDSIAKAKELAASIGGRAARIADTGSMAPTLTSSDIIVYKPTKVADINVGDIVLVTQQMDGQDHSISVFTHRVYNKAHNGEFWTKGDHNKSPDNWTSSDMNLKGIVVYIINGQTGEVQSVK